MALPPEPGKKVLDHGEAEAQRQAACPGLSLTPIRYSKILHFVRHGEGYHNVAGRLDHANYKSFDYLDAHLTATGWRQVRRQHQLKHGTASRWHLPPVRHRLPPSAHSFRVRRSGWECTHGPCGCRWSLSSLPH